MGWPGPRRRTVPLKLSDEEERPVRAIADAEHDGNLSAAIRALLAEALTARAPQPTLRQIAVRSESTPPNRVALAAIIAEKMGHERSDESPTCMDEDTTLGCRHANGHPAEPGCDTCCEYGWPCAPALAAADAVLAAAHVVVPRSPVAVSTSVDGMSPAEWG